MRNFLKYACLLLAGLLLSTACNGNNQASGDKRTTNAQKNKTMDNKKNSKVLIVFFSHAGENYAVGNIKVGNTKLVADEIRRKTGGDEFEIVAEKSYDMAYSDLTQLAQREAEQGEKPAFKGEVKDIAQYDTVFVGGPIWWGTYPQVMFTFFDRYDLNGKTIIPFSTHEGSGLGNVVSDLQRLYPEARIRHAFSIHGHECQRSLAKVDKWLEGIGKAD